MHSHLAAIPLRITSAKWRNSSTPLSTLTFQRLWLANTRKRMQLYIFKQGCDRFKNTWVTRVLPIISVSLCMFKQNYFHRSSMAIGSKLPLAIISSLSRRIFTISSGDMIYFVSSIACFLADNYLIYLTAFFIRPSSSAMMLSPRNNSAFCCNDVITSKHFDFCLLSKK